MVDAPDGDSFISADPRVINELRGRNYRNSANRPASAMLNHIGDLNRWYFQTMMKLQQQIAEIFLNELAKSAEVSGEKIEKLRAALSAAKKPKPDDLVKIFSEPDHGDIK